MDAGRITILVAPEEETTLTTPISEPLVDTPVYSADGEQFGYVKELQGGYFKIDVPMAKDYWLSTAYIDNCSMDRVSLNLKRDQIDEHRLSAPGAENQNSDRVLSSEDALAQRERMERELEEQRARLRAGQP